VFRKDLVKQVAKATGLNLKNAEVLVKAVLEKITEALSRGGRVEIRGLGTFEVRKRAPRSARNIRTGESVSLPERKVPYFKAGRILKNLVKRA
jgi:nucleoid DNA-binding protein